MSIVPFLGTYEVTVDSKNRIAIPAKWRDHVGDKIYVSAENDSADYLSIRTEAAFLGAVGELKSKSHFAREVKVLQRRLIGSAMFIELDKWKRFVVPQQLRNQKEFEGGLIFVGIGDYMELWGKKSFEKWKEDPRNSYEENGDHVSIST